MNSKDVMIDATFRPRLRVIGIFVGYAFFQRAQDTEADTPDVYCFRKQHRCLPR